MQGVEILTSAQVATEWVFNWDAFWITFGIIFSGCLIYGIIYSSCNHDWIMVLVTSIAGIIFGAFGGVFFGGITQIPVTYETQYKVTISDEVSMTEFYEHYEVIDQDGKIFTVREKTNDK